jgi:ubiquinone/menaquinone biosynthesis C-methylase UbiE
MKKSTELRLDLGCGQNKQAGHIGVDSVKCDGVDVVFDFASGKKWPWKDASVDGTVSSHFLEHLSGPQRMRFMDELYRVLKPGAQAQFVFPYWSSMRAIQDPTHAWPPLCETSFLYFNKQWREDNKLSHYPIKCDFDFSYGYNLAADTANKNEETRRFQTQKYVNSVNDLMITLVKK